jgi:hypothetical protein
MKHDRLLAIDPGTTHSGWVRCALVPGETVHPLAVLDGGVLPNGEMLDYIQGQYHPWVALEMIASYGMAVGKEVFETVRWIGRFQQACSRPDDVRLVYRKDVKLHLCGNPRAKDANIRQAIIDLYGGKAEAIGTVKKPGPLYGVKSHAWAALAVALTAAETKP